jgi:iron complex outermembrane receptor protein
MRPTSPLRLLATTSLFALLSSGVAFAQAADGAAAADVETIVVTGTRLQATGFNAPTPVTVVGSEAIQQRAAGTVLDALNDLPSFRNSNSVSSGSRAAGSIGFNTVNLRGLGGNRALVLLDGRRIVGYGGAGTIDTNVVPASLVERVEVVTGGASAAYGSDAVAGVVNFILKDRLEGIEGSYHHGFSQEGDNVEDSIQFAAGRSFMDGRLHAIFGYDFMDNGGVGTFYERDWGRREPGVLGMPATRAAGIPATVITENVEFATQTPGGLVVSGPLRGLAFGANGAPYQFQFGNTIAGNFMTGSTANYGNQTQSLQPIKQAYQRHSALARINFDVTEALTLYAEAAVANNRAWSRTFTYQRENNIIVSRDNPYLPDSVRAQMVAANLPTITIGRLNTEFGGIRSEPIDQFYNGVLGARGDIFGDWTWDASWQHGETREKYRPFGQVLVANYNAAIWAVRDPVSGQIVCGNPATNPNLSAAQRAQVYPGCVPFNLFGQGSPSSEALGYTGLNYLDTATRKRNQDTVQLNFAGSLFELPAGAVQLAFGGEWRNERYTETVSPESQARLFNVGNQQAYSGEVTVKEGFAEVGIPLLRDTPIARALDLNGAVRYTDYSTSGSVVTWKAGATWEPVEELRFRVTRSRDIRAPDISNLFAAGAGGTCPSCRGVGGAVGFVATRGGGNPNLLPEEADALTGGVVFQPVNFLSGFRASVDYYSIKLNGAIGSVAAQETIDRCLISNLAPFCNAITFAPGTAVGISEVRTLPQNLNQLKASGVDIELAYRVPASLGVPGALQLRVLGSYAHELKTIDDLPGGGQRITDAVGGSVAQWRWTFRADWNIGQLSLGAQARTQSTLKYDVTLIGPDDPAYNPAAANSINDNIFPKMMYVSLNAAYDLSNLWGGRPLTVFALVDNLLNTDPPLGYTYVGAGAGAGNYDQVGRSFKVGFRFKY